jgi:hypothetical protein
VVITDVSSGIRRANDQAYDAEARQRLWQLTMELTHAEKIDFVGD